MDNQLIIQCPRCEKEVSKTSKFCLECGNRLLPPDEVCRKCGKKMPSGSKFCEDCGFRLSYSSKDSIMYSLNSNNELWECQKCGAMNPNHSNACRECGKETYMQL